MNAFFILNIKIDCPKRFDVLKIDMEEKKQNFDI